MQRSVWISIEKRSSSGDVFDRMAALAGAVSEIEKALTASGVKEDRSGAAKRAGRLQGIPGWPDGAAFTAALKARNAAVHGGDTAPPNVCRDHIRVLNEAWCALRTRFVTRSTALTVASAILQTADFSSVLLFGSLARAQDPEAEWARGDIDLLVLDDGDISFRGSSYDGHGQWSGEERISDVVFDRAKLVGDERAAWSAAVQLGWLDIVVIDGKLLQDPLYIRWFSEQQSDPLFLLNVADGLKFYNKETCSWSDDVPPTFLELAKLRHDLQARGIVGPLQRRGRRRPRRRSKGDATK